MGLDKASTYALHCLYIFIQGCGISFNLYYPDDLGLGRIHRNTIFRYFAMRKRFTVLFSSNYTSPYFMPQVVRQSRRNGHTPELLNFFYLRFSTYELQYLVKNDSRKLSRSYFCFRVLIYHYYNNHHRTRARTTYEPWDKRATLANSL